KAGPAPPLPSDGRGVRGEGKASGTDQGVEPLQLEKLWSSTNAAFLLEPGKSDDRRVFDFTAMKVQWATTADVDGDGRLEFFTSSNGATGPPQAWGINSQGALVAKPGKPPVSAARAVPPNIPPLQA